MDYPQQQIPNLAGAIQGGFQIVQQAKANNLQMLAAQQELEQKNELRSLYKLAGTGDPQATQQLAIVAPDAFKGLKDYQTYKVQRGAQLANGIRYTELPNRPQAWKNAIVQYKNEFGVNPFISDEWSPEAEKYLDTIIAQARQVEDVAKEQYEAPKFQAELARTKAQTMTEGYQQRNYAANIGKTNLESQKLGEEIGTLKAERQNMEKLGISSPTAYKSYQTNMGQNLADRTKPLSQETAKTLGLAQDGIDILGQMKTSFFDSKTDTFNKSGFGKTAAGSLLPNVIAGEEAQKFATQKENLSDLVGRMRSGGSINKQEETRFLKLIPRFGDSESTVRYKLQQLDKEFSSVKSSIDPNNVRSFGQSQSSSNVINWGDL